MEGNVFGERLHEALVRVGVSQRELARRIGVSEVSVSRYTRGDREPDATMIRDIAQTIGVTTDWLLGVDSVEPRLMTLDEVRLIKKPMLLWCQDKYVKKPFPVECYGVRKVRLYKENKRVEMVATATDTRIASFYGSMYRLWTLKPTDEQMEAHPFSER